MMMNNRSDRQLVGRLSLLRQKTSDQIRIIEIQVDRKPAILENPVRSEVREVFALLRPTWLAKKLGREVKFVKERKVRVMVEHQT